MRQTRHRAQQRLKNRGHRRRKRTREGKFLLDKGRFSYRGRFIQQLELGDGSEVILGGGDGIGCKSVILQRIANIPANHASPRFSRNNRGFDDGDTLLDESRTHLVKRFNVEK